MGQRLITSVSAVVEPERESELTSGFRELIDGTLPEGLLRTELLRGQDGTWRIQSLWRDRDALMAVRDSGEPPASASGRQASQTRGRSTGMRSTAFAR